MLIFITNFLLLIILNIITYNFFKIYIIKILLLDIIRFYVLKNNYIYFKNKDISIFIFGIILDIFFYNILGTEIAILIINKYIIFNKLFTYYKNKYEIKIINIILLLIINNYILYFNFRLNGILNSINILFHIYKTFYCILNGLFLTLYI